MFWSGNYIAVRELNSLLKEENVTLSQVLEADDILQECKADNKALMLFLTRPDILNELITLITEEPPKHVELSQQYRHASIACEVLSSHLSMLSDRLSSDTIQMNRLCDFVNREPPLNPLLASYFSKTVEMLLEKSPKQDCYLYHIVCLRVLDFFKSRRDFLPNLLRHISTSAIADVFKYFIRLDDLFNKIVMEWFDEHQVLECLIQIVCGSYGGAEDTAPREKGAGECAEKEDLNHNQGDGGGDDARRVWVRRARVAAGNASALLGEVAATGCAADAAAAAASRTAAALAARLASATGVARLLAAAFSAAGAARAGAVAHAAALLLQLLRAAAPPERAPLELAVAPHLPLLHHALLHPPHHQEREAAAAVGLARLQVAALVAELAQSAEHDVCTALLALGTPGVLLDLLVQYPDNNFLHSSVVNMVRNALCNNPVYCTQYAEHLFVECDMLNRFMDLYEENENKEGGARRGHAGHVALVLAAARCAEARAAPPPHAAPRFHAFVDTTLRPLQHMLATPLGGTHPAESIYEVDCLMDTLAANFDFSDMAAAADDDLARDHQGGAPDDCAEFDDRPHAHHDQMNKAKSNFLELANQRFDDDMWEDAPAADELEAPLHFSPWASAPAAGEGEGEGWAHFDAAPAAGPAPAAPPAAPDAPFDAPFAPFWTYDDAAKPAEAAAEAAAEAEAEAALAGHLLTAMSAMSPAARARLVHIAADVAAHDVAPHDFASQDVVSHDFAPEHVAPQHVASQDVASQNVASQDVAPQSVTPQDVAPQHVAPQNVAPQSVAPQNVASEDVAPQNVAPQNVAPQSIAPQNVASKDVAPQNAPNPPHDRLGEPAAVEAAGVGDTPPAADTTPRLDPDVGGDVPRPAGPPPADTDKLQNAFEVVTSGTPGRGRPTDISPSDESDPWRATPDIRRSPDDADDEKSNVDVLKPANDTDKTELSSSTDSSKSSDDKSSNSPPTVEGTGPSDIEPSVVDDTCDSPVESER